MVQEIELTPDRNSNEGEKGVLVSDWGFATSFRAQFVGSGIWIVTEPLIYIAKNGEKIEVPSGFPTDLASVPRLLWWLYPPTGNYLPAAIVHDHLYWIQDRDRSKCDSILNEAMEKCDNVGNTTRWAVYSSVRIGGWKPFKIHKQNKKIRDAAQAILSPLIKVEPIRTIESIIIEEKKL